MTFPWSKGEEEEGLAGPKGGCGALQSSMLGQALLSRSTDEAWSRAGSAKIQRVHQGGSARELGSSWLCHAVT